MSPKRARPDPEIDLADRLHSAAVHLLRRVRRQDTATGLAAPRLSALSVVVFRGPLTVGQLARAEQVRSPTMTRLVAGLERAGLVERLPDPSDLRATLVRPTARGVRVLEEGRRRRVETLANDLGELAEADRQTIAAALTVLEGIVGQRHSAVSDASPPRSRPPYTEARR